jgi:(p)ppGpp synthase/HD superfamily hydrolase
MIRERKAVGDPLELAERIATRAHEGQFRRGGQVPYITHPRAVTEQVGDDPELKIVAWLHDVLENSNETADSLIKAGIPEHLVEAVVLLTHDKKVPYEEYMNRIASSRIATTVKIADMVSNLTDKPTTEQIRKYSKGLLILTRCAGGDKAN